MNIFRAWLELSESEKTQIYLTLTLVCIAMVIVLYVIATSRGQDVEYLKARLGLMEARVNYMDQKIDKINQTYLDQRDHLNEIRRMQEANQRLQEDNQRWIEHWKNLPNLPKPSQKR